MAKNIVRNFWIQDSENEQNVFWSKSKRFPINKSHLYRATLSSSEEGQTLGELLFETFNNCYICFKNYFFILLMFILSVILVMSPKELKNYVS